MAQTSPKEEFFSLNTYALVGDSEGRRYPKLSRKHLEERGKTVYPVDLAGGAEAGTLASLEELPEDVDAAVIEVADERTQDVVRAVLDRGIRRIWLHQGTDVPEAVELCRSEGADVHTGGCAVMYLAPTVSPHALHRAVWKLIGRY